MKDTPMTTDTVEITQADRDAADRLDAGLRWVTLTKEELAEAFARHRISSTPQGTEPVGYACAEHLSRRSEFERNGSVIYHRPSGTCTMPLFASPPSTDEGVRIAVDTHALNDIADDLVARKHHWAANRVRDAARALAALSPSGIQEEPKP